MLEWFWVSLTVIFLLFVSVSACLENLFVYVWLCGFKFTGNFFPNSFCLWICILISMYVCVCIYIYEFVCFQLDAFVREHVWHKV